MGYITKHLPQFWMGLLFFSFTISLYAQSTNSIQLLDEDNAQPIQVASFQYGNQNGISDENGFITFVFTPGEVMRLSHVNYGSWTWDEASLQDLIRQKVYYRKSIVLNLQPATIIGLRPTQQPEDRINIDYQERMEHDGAAILSKIPAISSIRKGGNYGFDPVFRGFKYNQLNVVLNGVQSATAACPNRMDPPTSQMAPNMMDKIEILKGPHALRFGTGFGGTINFVQTRSRFTEDPDTYGRFSSEYQSNGNLLRSEGQIGFSNDNYDLSLFGAWSQGDDYESGNGQTVPADFLRGSFGANLGAKLSARQQIQVSALYNMARDADFPALGMDLRKDDTWMFNARHELSLDGQHLKSWNTSVFGSLVDHLMDNLLKPLDPRMLNAATNAHTYNYGGRTEGNWQFANGRLFAGADLRTEGAEGIRTREFLMGPNAGKIVADNAWQDSYISKTGFFGEYHLHAGKTKYVFSSRFELNYADVKDPSDEFIVANADSRVTQFNPSFSLGVQQQFSDQFKAGLWLGRAQQSGSLTERYINYFSVGQDPYEMLGNPDLAPEVNNQVDLNLQWTMEKASIHVDLFASYLQDFISSVIDTSLSPRLPTSPGVRRFVNLDRAFKTGFEVNWTQQLPIGLTQQLGMAYTYAQDLDREQPLPEIAPLDFRYVLRGSYLNDRLQPELHFRHVLEQSRVSTEFGESVTPAFSLLDVKLAYRISDALRCSAGVNNVFDENYYEHLSRSVQGSTNPIFAPGRNLFGSVSVVF